MPDNSELSTHGLREGSWQTMRTRRACRERLNLWVSMGRPELTGWPWSRVGENLTHGILGGALETWRWWRWEPTLQSKERGWKPST
jgi:hypothetical protein